MTRFENGRASLREIDMIWEITRQMEGHTICGLADASAWPIQGLLRHFRPVVEERIKEYVAKHGTVLYGGRLASERRPDLAIPANVSFPDQASKDNFQPGVKDL